MQRKYAVSVQKIQRKYAVLLQKIQRKTGSVAQKMHRTCFIPFSNTHGHSIFLRQYVLTEPRLSANLPIFTQKFSQGINVICDGSELWIYMVFMELVTALE